MTSLVLIAAVVLVIALVLGLVAVLVGGSRRRLGPPVPVEHLDPAVRAGIDSALTEGQTVLAIKRYREAVPTSLVDAKNTIEAYAGPRGNRA